MSAKPIVSIALLDSYDDASAVRSAVKVYTPSPMKIVAGARAAVRALGIVRKASSHDVPPLESLPLFAT